MTQGDTIDNVGKRLPYIESDAYLDNLLDRVGQVAIDRQHHSRATKRWSRMLVSTAALVLLLLGIGFTVMNNSSPQHVAACEADGPVDEFLNSLTDEEVAQLTYYEIEEIPEY